MRDYLYIVEALKCCKLDKKSNREFGLANSNLCSNPINILKAWAKRVLTINSKEDNIQNLLLYIKRIWILAIIVAFIFGIASSISLLTYSGLKPVNIFYFLIFTTILPLIGLIITILSILELRVYNQSIFVDFMPPYWIVSLLKKDKYKIPTKLLKAYTIYMSQVVSFIFYLSMLIGLVGVISIKDVAFGWSSTLLITPAELHRFFETLAIWQDLIPQAVPSSSLIEHSHYYQVEWHPKDVAELGQWWRFLAMSLVVYAILPRVILIPFTYILYKRVEKDTILALDRVNDIIDEICKPIIETTVNSTKEEILEYQVSNSVNKRLLKEYDIVASWAIDIDELKQILSTKEIKTNSFIELGGDRDINSDISAIESIRGKDMAIVVKSWEPPTMDLVDIIEYLSKRGIKVDIIPIGFSDDNFECSDEDFNIWQGKIDYLNIKHIKVVKV